MTGAGERVADEDKPVTPSRFHFAASRNSPEGFLETLEEWASEKEKSLEWDTPHRLAPSHRWVIDRQDARLNTPLHWIAHRGIVAMSDFLVTLGANPVSSNHAFVTPVEQLWEKDLAASCPIVSRWMDQGFIDPDWRSGVSHTARHAPGSTLLHVLMIHANPGKVFEDMVDSLIRGGVDPDEVNADGHRFDEEAFLRRRRPACPREILVPLERLRFERVLAQASPLSPGSTRKNRL